MHKIPDLQKNGNLYNLEVGESIWQHKAWDLSKFGGIVMSFPAPTPLSFRVFGLEHMMLEPGQFIMVARDNSNNPVMQFTPNPKNPMLLQAEQIKESLIGQIKRIDKDRIVLESELLTEYGEVGYPKVRGAVAKIVGYNRDLVDEKDSTEIEKAKKLHGSKWAEKLNNGAWLRE